MDQKNACWSGRVWCGCQCNLEGLAAVDGETLGSHLTSLSLNQLICKGDNNGLYQLVLSG